MQCYIHILFGQIWCWWRRLHRRLVLASRRRRLSLCICVVGAAGGEECASGKVQSPALQVGSVFCDNVWYWFGCSKPARCTCIGGGGRGCSQTSAPATARDFISRDRSSEPWGRRQPSASPLPFFHHGQSENLGKIVCNGRASSECALLLRSQMDAGAPVLAVGGLSRAFTQQKSVYYYLLCHSNTKFCACSSNHYCVNIYLWI